MNYLKEERDLLGRLLLVPRYSRNIAEKDALRSYEFIVFPKNLFAGKVHLSCSIKCTVAQELNAITQNIFQSNALNIGDAAEDVTDDDLSVESNHHLILR